MQTFTGRWAEACRAELNRRGGFRAAAPEWKETVVLVSREGGTGGADRAIRLDFRDGECLAAGLATDEDRRSAPYVFEAPTEVWSEMLEAGLDPIAAVMRGNLRLTRGNLFALARYGGAARELVVAAQAAALTREE